MRILTAAQMKDAEDAAVAAGTSYMQLMENAGTAAAEAIAQIAHEKQLAHTALLLCGRGNNAGDAFVAARLLGASGWRCEVLLLMGDALSTLAAGNYYKLPRNVKVADAQSADFTSAVIVDGVFGTGFHGGLPHAVCEAFAKANAQQRHRIALDVPSGINCDTGAVAPGTFMAHETLTFGAYKPGLLTLGNTAYTGEVILLDIGL